MALTILGIHGLGDHRNEPWADRWEEAIRGKFPAGFDLKFEPFAYDDIFEKVKISPSESASAFVKLAGSGLVSGFTGFVDGLFGRRGARGMQPAARGPLDGLEHWLKWYAGYIVGWLEDEGFRTEVRRRLLKTIADVKPDVILAHSLGSLISFDAFTSDADLAKHVEATKQLKRVSYVTLGSQLANPFVVRNLTPGRIEVPDVKRWWHLYNREDDVFTAPVRIPGDARFLQVDTFFDIEGWADHEATAYLSHSSASFAVWQPLAMETSQTRSVKLAGQSRMVLGSAGLPQPAAKGKAVVGAPKSQPGPKMRALLVGINEYPDPASRLAGCVNDVYLTSSVLQECGFDAEQIRVVLDARATASGIRDRLEWLVDGARPGDTLFFFYSGHGAQLPTYGDGDAVDRMDETLVPYDFDWSPASCITDDAIYDLYSQLPYDTRLVMVFDCCHSGGIHRDGAPKARGLTPPDDIRHRCLKWDAANEMWIAREFAPLTPGFREQDANRAAFCGAKGSVSRLGRAMRLRGLTDAKYDAAKKSAKGKQNEKSAKGKKDDDPPVGPYLPVILEACQENQLAFEYRNGAESYGAFTYSLAKTLELSKKSLSFVDLRDGAASKIEGLGYSQVPAILGPSKIVNAPVPWLKVSAQSKPKRKNTTKKN